MIFPEGFKKETLDKYPKFKEFFIKLNNSPLMEISTPTGAGRIYAKCEWNHPSGSIKAKVACAMVWKLLDDLKENLSEITILEYSGGCLSLALAELCHMLNIKLVITLMECTHKSVLNELEQLNAKVVLTNNKYGFYGTIEKAMELKQKNPSWKFLFQHENFANYDYHKSVTAQEILLNKKIQHIDAWVASIGTGGTLSGVYKGISERFPDVQLHTNTPSEMPYGTLEYPNALPKFAGSGGLGCGRRQKFVEMIEDKVVCHHVVSFAEAKQSMLDFYRLTNIPIGSSAAANLFVAKKIAKNLGKGTTTITTFPSLALPEELEEMNKA